MTDEKAPELPPALEAAIARAEAARDELNARAEAACHAFRAAEARLAGLAVGASAAFEVWATKARATLAFGPDPDDRRTWRFWVHGVGPGTPDGQGIVASDAPREVRIAAAAALPSLLAALADTATIARGRDPTPPGPRDDTVAGIARRHREHVARCRDGVMCGHLAFATADVGILLAALEAARAARP